MTRRERGRAAPLCHALLALLVLACGSRGGQGDGTNAQASETARDERPAPTAAGTARQLAGQGALDYSRIAVVGASVSAGFLGSPMAVELEGAIDGEHTIENLADVFFFRAPWKNGTQQIERALAARPTVILALDFLFWYAYMSGADTEYRLRSLNRGLGELERIEGVPVIVGDIPDMRGAAAWMLPPEVVPPVEDLRVLNQRIREWAHDRKNVEVAPLASWAEPLITGESVEHQGQTLTAKELMAPDGLHLNKRGVRYLLGRMDEHLERAFPDTPEAALHIDD